MPALRRTKTDPGPRSRRQTVKKAAAALVRTVTIEKKRRPSKMTTKAEVASIARNEALRVLDTKYFATNSITNWYPHQSMATPAAGAAANQNRRYQVSAVGFSSTIATEAMDPDATTSMYYPGYDNVAIHPLQCLRSMPLGNLNTIESHFVVPVKAETVFSLARQPALLTDYEAVSGGHGLAPGWQDSMPIRVRIIRVTPKIAPGVSTNIDPKNDLFLNDAGEPFGIDTNAASASAGNNWSPQMGMSPDSLRSQPVNKLKYTVLNDRQVVLGPTCTVAPASPFAITSGTNGFSSSHVSYHPKPPSTIVRFTHQLTNKKGGKVKYEKDRDDPAANPVIASDGQRREYIFFHFMWDTGLATFLPKDAANRTGGDFIPVPPPLASAVRIVATATSTFKDG